MNTQPWKRLKPLSISIAVAFAFLMLTLTILMTGCIAKQPPSLCVCTNSTNANLSQYLTNEYTTFMRSDYIIRTWPLNATQTCENETYTAFNTEFTCHDYSKTN